MSRPQDARPPVSKRMAKTLMTALEVAEYLQVTRGKVYQLVADGQLKSYKLGAGRTAPLRFSMQDLEVFLNQAATPQP